MRQRLAGTRRARAAAGAAVVALLVAVPSVLSGCSNGGLPEPVTEQGGTVVQVWQVFLWGAVAIAALIWFLVFYAIITSARRKRQIDPADPDADIPPQTQYRTRIEVVYTCIPLVIVIGLFALTLWGNQALLDRSARPDLTINVVGFQWQWQFNYADYDVTVGGASSVLPDLYLPVGSTVRFNLDADDVIHSFWVPEFLEKRDLIPGVETNTIEVSVTKAGTWIGRCAEYCGLNHWQMKFNVYAVPRDQFDAWIAAQPKGVPLVAGVHTTEGGTVPPPTGTRPPTTGHGAGGQGTGGRGDEGGGTSGGAGR